MIINKLINNKLKQDIMDKKVFYVSPDLVEVELNPEGVLCTSESDGQIDQLKEGPDWSDMWNN